MGVVFACVAPHAWFLVRPIAGGWGGAGQLTHDAMEELGRRARKVAPETLVVMTPHGLHAEGAISLLDNRRLRGTLGNLAEEGGNSNSVSVEFDTDRELNNLILETGRSLGVPLVRVSFGLRDSTRFPFPLDFGAIPPLWFMGVPLHPAPKLVVVCAGSNLRCELAWEIFPVLGRAIAEAARRLGRTVGFIASADLGHAHDHNGPMGFDPAAAEFDASVVAAVEANALQRLATFDYSWVRRARTDAYGQLLTLHGLVECEKLRGEFLSYELPSYFGMLCASYE